ncbi:MAG TPA: hypothetical protein VGJ00_02925 [Rhabdochlamydiaceae bacterium]|jgi:hypothetical protein
MLWNRRVKKAPSLEVFVRCCYASTVSDHKERFKRFSRENCYRNLMQTADDVHDVHFTFFLDGAKATQETHFLKAQNSFPVIEITAGTEALSFLAMLDYVLAQNYNPQTIIYFLEDDYLHKPNWVEILKEGFTLPHVDYVTLFDHKDKYFSLQYPYLLSHLFHTSSCHWRTTPSTTNTYAMLFSTLQRDAALHRQYSQGRSITADHEKFCALARAGAALISSVPGWATHVDPPHASPCTDWESFLH